jgi:hypothetical protein
MDEAIRRSWAGQSPIVVTEVEIAFANRDRKATFIGMSKLDAVVAELKTLPPAGLEAAADFIHQLRVSGATERKHALERSFGGLTPEEADEMERAIAANCERIDAGQW